MNERSRIKKQIAFKSSGKKVYLGGNIGKPLLPLIEQMQPSDYVVAELSSFQLISMRQSPQIAVVTNLAPNHLDHHTDMDEYVNAKRNILKYQLETDVAILNYENDVTRSFAEDVVGSLRWFSTRRRVPDGAWVDEEKNLYLTHDGVDMPVMNLGLIKLPGAHNRENIATAAAAVRHLVSLEDLRGVASRFPGVEHRIELVTERNGVRWYNDSIGTSPTRTIAGLRSFDQKIILLAGGYDKKISYAPLAPDIIEHVKILLLCGNTAEVIRAEVEKRADYPSSGLVIEMTENLQQSVGRAYEMAKDGDVVMLSPASASFDCYPNFEERGRHFKQLVAALYEEQDGSDVSGIVRP
jgi:UDP-N-acetylmuramoylalanine--D-glutamate ligase